MVFERRSQQHAERRSSCFHVLILHILSLRFSRHELVTDGRQLSAAPAQTQNNRIKLNQIQLQV